MQAFASYRAVGALVVVLALAGGRTARAAAETGEPFLLVDGERVIFLGGALVEQSQHHEYLETRLTARFPRRQVSFRNLGWSGDTVWGDARAGFDTPVEGYQRLVELVRELDPTVIFVCYGGNEAFAGPAGIEAFDQGLKRLLDDLSQSGARLVLVTPPPHERLGGALPDPAEINRHLAQYSGVIRDEAARRGATLVDLNRWLVPEPAAEARLTHDGMHLSAYGYWKLAEAVDAGLGWTAPQWRVAWDRQQGSLEVGGAVIERFEAAAEGLSFTLTDLVLPAPPCPLPAGQRGTAQPGRILKARGLEPGRYTLRIDGHVVHSADALEWAAGIALVGGPETDQVEELRRAIQAKNRLYFHRWRPQNETYLFGFRKHEQGQNAAEVPQFDPLVIAGEEQIAGLRGPRIHQYQLAREPQP